MIKDLSKTSILIPGPWKDDREFVAVVARSFKYIFLGRILMKIGTEEIFHSFVSFDYNISYNKEAFPELDDYDIQSINSIFIIEVETGDIDNFLKLFEAISFILNIGGLGVKILNSGRQTFIKKQTFGKNFTQEMIFDVLVSVSYSDDGVFTWGMHNFNQKNVFAPLAADKDAFNLIINFAYYIINENPEIKDGETFSLDINLPSFVIFQSDDKELAGLENAIYNSLGFWKLLPQK